MINAFFAQNGFLVTILLASLVFASCNKDNNMDPSESIEVKITTAQPLTTEPVDSEPRYTPTDTLDITPVEVSGGVLRCNEVAYTAKQVRQLINMAGSDGTTGKIYPGAIIQGGNLQAGQFTEVTIPKAGGMLFLSGLSRDNSVVEQVIEVESYTAGEVQNAIDGYLAQIGSSVRATTADFGLFIEETNSNEEFYFHLGLDARFKLNKVAAQMAIEKERTGSLVTMQFTQKYYSVFINTPETMFSLFRDGPDARDLEGQIGPNNPPLYVSRVDYGRQIFFRAESTASTKDVKTILQAASRQTPLGDIKLESGLSAREVLEKTQIDYYVRGGSAQTALQNAPTYESVLQVIQEGAEWSLDNPAALIGYELNYLVNRQPAVMAFAADFVRKSCELDAPNVSTYRIKLDRIQCYDCEPFGEIEDGNAEFTGEAFIRSNQETSERRYRLNINGVSVNGGIKSYGGPAFDFDFEDVGPGDKIFVRGYLTEQDNTNDDSFGELKREIDITVFDNGGEFSLDFKRGSGWTEQRARVWFVVTKLK